MSIERNQLLDITKTVLNELGIRGATGIELTYVQKVKGEWRVSFNFTPSMSWSKSAGCFSIDAESGEITFSALDKIWKI
jgi:hypothetical protein